MRRAPSRSRPVPASRFAGAATLDVQATGSITVLAKNGDLTAAETVRINSRGAPVSLLAPNGRVTVPASVLVAAPVTTPVVPPAPIISASNTVPALSEQYNPLNQLSTPNNVTSAAAGEHHITRIDEGSNR